MKRIEFDFNNSFSKNYKIFIVTPSFMVIWDTQFKQDGMKDLPPHDSLALLIVWLFWGVGIEIRFPLKKKKKVTGSGTANKIPKFK